MEKLKQTRKNTHTHSTFTHLQTHRLVQWKGVSPFFVFHLWAPFLRFPWHKHSILQNYNMQVDIFSLLVSPLFLLCTKVWLNLILWILLTCVDAGIKPQFQRQHISVFCSETSQSSLFLLFFCSFSSFTSSSQFLFCSLLTQLVNHSIIFTQAFIWFIPIKGAHSYEDGAMIVISSPSNNH